MFPLFPSSDRLCKSNFVSHFVYSKKKVATYKHEASATHFRIETDKMLNKNRSFVVIALI